MQKNSFIEGIFLNLIWIRIDPIQLGNMIKKTVGTRKEGQKSYFELFLWLLAIAVPGFLRWFFRAYFAFWQPHVYKFGRPSLFQIIASPFLYIAPWFGYDNAFLFFINIILPSIPFISLAFLHRKLRYTNIYRSYVVAFIGSTIGALLGILPLNIRWWYLLKSDLVFGADIGYGFLFLTQPAYIIILMVIGWKSGREFYKHFEKRHKNS
jgi:hypothetical protein